MSSEYLNRLRATAIRFFDATSHISAPLIVTFLLVHLSAPASATFGGGSLASQTMLLGREYYQTRYAEPLLVLTPLTLHALSGLLKRLISPTGKLRPLTHLLSITGYATMFLFLPIHFLTHREYPTIETSPIAGVGPAELDYEFVKTGLTMWPVRSFLLYGGLVLSTTLHMADGLQVIWNSYSWLRGVVCGTFPRRLRRTAFTLGIMAVPTLLGLYFLSKEPSMTFADLTSRYQAVYLSSRVYQI